MSDSPWDLVVDATGRIVQITPGYAQLLGLDPARVIGCQVEHVVDNTRMHRVLATGVPEMVDLWETNGRKLIISRMPIVWHGRVVGAAAALTFGSLQEARHFAHMLERAFPDSAPVANHLSEGAHGGFQDMVAQSPATARAAELARMAARSNSTVLLTGETGTGKEVFAHAIHQASARARAPFVKVNCAALPRDLLESELFGYEDGAFTGARRGGKPGKFEQASGGTLFLDEIGDMPLELQPKLLRVLQDMEVDRLGSVRSTRVDVRLVIATNANLEQLVKAGKFRADLYYRLSVVTVALPPLRERVADLPGLVAVILNRLNRQMGTLVKGLTTDALALLAAYAWPGNVRELQNVLERALNAVNERQITREHLLMLAPHLAGKGPAVAGELPGLPENGALDLRNWMHEAECMAIQRALAAAAGNKTRAAELLGIHRTVLHEKIKKHGLAVDTEPAGS